RARHQLRGLRRQRLCHVQEDRLGRGPRQRHGPSRRVRSRRLRPRTLHRLRVWRRHRAARAPQVGRRGYPPLLRERPEVPGAVSAVRVPYQWLHELVAVSGGVEAVATTLGLRGFEVASVEQDPPVIDFEITANRPDCLSIIGLAREAAAAYALPLRLPDRTVPPAQEITPLDVEIEDAHACPRYCAQIFAVRLGASPAWLRERLDAAGLRSINNVVDVTNYVMIEMGQPTHAFDLERLGGRALRIRAARAGERLRTLDGVDRTLEAGMLVIADAERPQAVGGVMGGATSEISDATKTMVLESAYFT